jgi:phosphate transport system substrate-binding protein
MHTRTGLILGAGLAAAVTIAGCGSNNNGSSPGSTNSNAASNSATGCASGALRGAGSTFQDPMEQNWISGFAGQCSGARVSYNAVGSGTGIQNFGAAQVDFAGSDVTMKPDEQSKADQRCGSKAIHIPVTAGGVGVTYHLSGITSLQLSASTIAQIFTGKVKFWDDAAVKSDNPGATLPHTSVKVFTRSDPSGTTAVFTGFLSAAAPSDWTLGSAKDLQFPVGTGKPKSNGVAAAVKGAEGGVTYVEEAYATQNNLSLAKVKNAGGTYVELTPANVSTALDSATTTGAAPDLSEKINFTPSGATAYPISTVSYVIVCSKYPSSFTGVDLLKGYLKYAVTTGQAQATSLGFAPLPATTAQSAQASIATIS